MKVQTSVSLSEELLSQLDEQAHGEEQRRSEILEMAAWAWLRASYKERQRLNDLAEGRRADQPDIEEYSARWDTLGDEFGEEDFAVAAR